MNYKYLNFTSIKNILFDKYYLHVWKTNEMNDTIMIN